MEEEFAEYKEVRTTEGKNLEELADMMEIVFGLAKTLGYSEEELMRKREERGGFQKGIVLDAA
jgi:predicted house-cleaning noncanonical NTP pyrophosphatase (MazG superfamily)